MERLACAALVAAIMSVTACANLGEIASDAAFAVSQASDMKRCRETYERTGDAFRLAACEQEAASGEW
jgi:hypothetical protein